MIFKKELGLKDASMIPCELEMGQSPRRVERITRMGSGVRRRIYDESAWFEREKEEVVASCCTLLWLLLIIDDEEVIEIKPSEKWLMSCYCTDPRRA